MKGFIGSVLIIMNKQANKKLQKIKQMLTCNLALKLKIILSERRLNA